MQIQNDLQHFCCGPKGCQIELDTKWRKRNVGSINNSTQDDAFLDVEF